MNHDLTNTEFVAELMQFSPYGALVQVFIIDAIHKHAKAVSRAAPSEVDRPLICGEAWVGVAKDIKAKLDARYGIG